MHVYLICMHMRMFCFVAMAKATSPRFCQALVGWPLHVIVVVYNFLHLIYMII